MQTAKKKRGNINLLIYFAGLVDSELPLKKQDASAFFLQIGMKKLAKRTRLILTSHHMVTFTQLRLRT